MKALREATFFLNELFLAACFGVGPEHLRHRPGGKKATTSGFRNTVPPQNLWVCIETREHWSGIYLVMLALFWRKVKGKNIGTRYCSGTRRLD